MYGWRNSAVAFDNFDTTVVVATNHWSLPASSADRTSITEFIGAWLSSQRPEVELYETRESWAWKTAYVCGLMYVESINGFVGIAQPIDSSAD